LSPPRISRLLFASPWVEMAPMRYFQQRCERLSRFSSASCSQRSGCAPPFLVGGSLLMPLASLSPSYRVHTSDLLALQSCAATVHMERRINDSLINKNKKNSPPENISRIAWAST
jgi:hypothetical protein